MNTHKNIIISSAAFIAAALVLSAQNANAQHTYAGIIDTNGTPGLQAGDALSFVVNSGVNGGNVVSGSSFGVLQALPVLVGDQAGLFANSQITFTALAGTGLTWTGAAYRAASAYAADPGSYIELLISSVTGPSGAKFSFWDDGDTAPSFTTTIGAGPTPGVGSFLLTNDGITYGDQPQFVGDGVSDSIGEPPTTPNGTSGTGGITVVDPYGHIHGRSFTFDTEGDYTVSFILQDKSGTHPNSAPFSLEYHAAAAVPEPTTFAMIGGAALVLGAFGRRRSMK